MYIDRIWPFTTFISRNKHKKNIRLRLYWLRLRVAEAEVQTSHGCWIDMTMNKENKLTPSCRTCALETTAPSAVLLIYHVQPPLIQVSCTSPDCISR